MSIKFQIGNTFSLLGKDLNLDPLILLRRANLPSNLFQQPNVSLETHEYMALWQAISDEKKDPLFALKIVNRISFEYFNPAMFSAICSPNFEIAIKRLAKHKLLCGPMRLHIEVTTDELSISPSLLHKFEKIPDLFWQMESLFFVQFIRMATRESIRPKKILCKAPLDKDEFQIFLGIQPELSKENRIVFHRNDVQRPFLTANPAMWNFFAPQLQQELLKQQENLPTAEKVKICLLEIIPAGQGSIDIAAKKLGTSKRTLQRRLKSEGTSFQEVLHKTREELALFYLRETEISYTEIAFLLGFDEPSSFFRAFQQWRGETPETVRKMSA